MLVMWTLLLALGACAPPPYSPGTGDTGDVEDQEDTGISINITWPLPESPVTGCAMFVVEIQNLRLVDASVSPDPVDGQGHYHLLYDGKYTPCYTPYCLVALETEGLYTVEAKVTANDHSPLLDENGNEIITELPLQVTAGECDLGEPLAGYP